MLVPFNFLRDAFGSPLSEIWGTPKGVGGPDPQEPPPLDPPMNFGSICSDPIVSLKGL